MYRAKAGAVSGDLLPYLKHTITPQGTITVLLVVLQLHCNTGYMYLSGRKSVQVHCHVL